MKGQTAPTSFSYGNVARGGGRAASQSEALRVLAQRQRAYRVVRRHGENDYLNPCPLRSILLRHGGKARMFCSNTPLEVPKNPQTSAIAVGLRYVTDDMPGIRRERKGERFAYIYPTGDPAKDAEVLLRIKALAIPPAWTDVWICPDPCGHLQATGRDQRGRKQHRYHPRWREIRDETKYARMITFARALPRIRRKVNRLLRGRALSRQHVLGAVIRLLEVSLIRVGNEEYARENCSFGLTTMRDAHVDVRRGTLRFHFRGKSGKWHEIDIEDRRLARTVKRCQDIPGQDLFQYLDEDGNAQKVTSTDVNSFLREISGQDFTAKDFRTWAGTVLATMALQEFKKFDSQAESKRNVTKAIERVAQRLGNTVAVCRKCYIHPEVISCYLDGNLNSLLQEKAAQELKRGARGLPAEEASVLQLLQRRLAAVGNCSRH